MILASTLIVQADAIDNRVGPIPGPLADRIAVQLREAAAAIELLKREISAASVTVQAGGKEWATVPAIKTEIERFRETLAKIAKQKTTEEMDEFENDRADFEGGYDGLVLLARSTINP